MIKQIILLITTISIAVYLVIYSQLFTFYFFSVSATGEFLYWSVIGCLLLVLLFYFSAKFSERISSKKYPEYKDYQKNTPIFIGF